MLRTLLLFLLCLLLPVPQGALAASSGKTPVQAETSLPLNRTTFHFFSPEDIAANYKASKIIRVGYFDQHGVFEGEGEHLSGYAVALLTAISRYTGWEYKWVKIRFDELAQRLDDGTIDLSCGISFTPERSRLYSFSKLRAGYENTCLHVSSMSDMHYMDLEAFNGMRIGFFPDSLQYDVMKRFAAQNGFSFESFFFEESNEMSQALAEGRIDEEGAIEFFQCMWASMAQCLDLAITPYNKATHEGYSHWEAVTVGGQTRDGRDATNELSYIIMRSKRECPLHYPDLAARVHSRSPERFLTAVAEMIKQGCGFPKLLNDDEIIPLHLAKGAPLEDIYDYAASGCAEIRMPRVDTYTSGHAQMNFGAAVELVLYNGRMKKYGDELLTVETGDVRNFTTWEEFWQAYATQQNYLMRHAFMQQYHIIKARAQHFATPISDALHVLAMKECVDLHQDHHYEGGLDLGYFECLGYSTAIDSLSAVRKLVFDDKKLTMQELLDALECNFEGKEDVRKMLQSAPCYGNNDDYADSIGLEIDRLAQEFSKKYAPRLGIKCDFRMVPFTSHVPFGRVVSATPNGRKAWTPLSDGSSASHGADVNGPTAVLLSNFNSKNYNMFQRAARLLNIKFTPSCLAGKEGTRKLVSFIRAFVDLRLWHVQFNVVNRQTLVNAQKDPEKYRGLIVRIAGYSAYFTELSKDLQDDLIARTQHEQV